MNTSKTFTRRRVAALSAATSAALVLGACGAGGIGNDGAGENGELTVLVEGGGLGQLEPVAEAFTEETGTEITFVELPYDSLYDRLSSDLSAGAASFDVAALDAIWLPTFAGGLEPLDDVVTDDVQADLFDSLIEEAQQDGTFVGMPAWTNVQILLYRTDLFEDPEHRSAFEEEHGYPLAPPATWEEYEDIARFFTEHTDGYGTDVKGAVETEWLALVLQAGAEAMVVDEEGTVVIDDEAHLAALDAYTSLATDAPVVPSGANQIDWVEAQNLFNQGQTAMTRFWAHAYTQVPEESGVHGNVGVAPMPAGEAGLAGVPGAWYLSVPESTPQTEVAKEFVSFAFEHNELGLDTALGLAASRSALEEGAQRDGHENLGVVIETLEAPGTAGRPAIPEWQRIVDEVLIPMLQSAVAGSGENQQLLDDAKTQIEDILG